MKAKKALALILICIFALCGCKSGSESTSSGSDLSEFRNQVDSFNAKIAEIDSAINSVNTSEAGFEQKVTGSLNELNTAFSDFSNTDFPEEFDYLEHLADEAAEYMNSAVSIYISVYTDDSLSPESMQEKFDEADKQYSNAFKRIKVIMTFLNGEVSEDADVQRGDGTLTNP